MTNIEKAVSFLTTLFDESTYLQDKASDKQYRLDHTFRVANIGREIAQKEGLDEEALVIGCLLHDISYVHEMKTNEDRKNHGRLSASMARDFVMSLDMKDHLKHELLYGIAIHVDDHSDFLGDRTLLAETIGEADNIDRFDKYRLYEHLLNSQLNQKTLDDQIAFTKKQLTGLNKLKTYVFKTNTSNQLWRDNIHYQEEYFTKLLGQLKNSKQSSII